MFSPRFLHLATAVSILLTGTGTAARADSFGALEQICAHATLAAAPDSPDYRRYAPDRNVNITHLALDVTPDFDKQTVAGEVTLTFQPIAKPLEELRLDGVDLTVLDVKSSSRLASHHATDQDITVTFAKAFFGGSQVIAIPPPQLYVRNDVPGALTVAPMDPPSSVAGSAL